jgi:KaiC/GvpD/RAD55 family RecA-like ATPase
MNYDNIPNELKDLDRWVVWREGKIPYDAKYVNSRASSTNPDTWSSFEAATTAYEESNEALGIGFVLNGDGLVGVDIDHVVTDGVVEPAAVELLDQLGAAYISLSPSGHGLRAFGYATPLLQGCKGVYQGMAVELYSSQRYLTVTDQTLRHEPLRELNHFEALAYHIRSDKHVDTATGEVIDRKPTERHAELIKRVITGEVLHDSLRDLAASLVASGGNHGSIVNHLRGLMEASAAPRDQRYYDRYKQIPALVRTAGQKYQVFDPFAGPDVKEDESLLDSMGAVFANELPTEFEPEDELVEELLSSRTTAMMYGESNTGKSFLAVAMAAAISNGTDFLGLRTQHGMAVYLATESPSSIRMRLQAYQKYYECSLDNLLIIQRPIDLYTDESDAAKIIEVIKQAEDQRQMKATFIVADTLARMLNGGDENSLTAMQPLLNRVDRLMNATEATVMLVHHTQKSGTAARGHSSLQAHIDSSFHITEEDGERLLTVSKQRSLSSKHNSLRFNLETITMGYSKFGRPVSTCIATA